MHIVRNYPPTYIHAHIPVYDKNDVYIDIVTAQENHTD